MAMYETKSIPTDGLLAALNPAAEAFTVTIKGLSAPATLARGTVLAIDADGKMIVLGSGTGTANCILCDDTEVGTADVKAIAYRTGHFAAEKLIVADSYTLTAADKEALRDAGILLSNTVEM